MKRVLLFALLTCFLSNVALAGGGNGAPSGAHYNLNIIGVENPKKAEMRDSKRHTIFVALGSKNGRNSTEVEVETRIYLTRGDFEVCDGNGFDAAYDCFGNPVGRETQLGAVFQLPCNTALDGSDQIIIVPCDGNGDVAAYNVWIRALGAPGGGATITTCAYDDENQLICSSENVVLYRYKSKPSFTNVTNELTSIVADIGDGEKRYALFSSDLEDWFWQYLNRGLRLAQVQFYIVP